MKWTKARADRSCCLSVADDGERAGVCAGRAQRLVRHPDVRGLHRTRARFVPGRLHRHADERRGARQGAAATPRAFPRRSSASASRSHPGWDSTGRSACGSGARSTTAASSPGCWAATICATPSGSGWTDGRTRRRTRGIRRRASRPGTGKATRWWRTPRTSRRRGSGEASAFPAATGPSSPS